MFKMIGGDGREYGPVTTEQLREWIAENRANGQTLVQAEGTSEWRPVAAFPEFADLLGSAAAVASPLPTQPQTGAVEMAWIAPPEDYEFSIGQCLGRGWQLLIRHFLLITGASSLVWLVLTASSLSCVGGVVGLIMGGALHGGLTLLVLHLIRGQSAGLSDLLLGFSAGFVPLMLIWIVTHFLSAVGMVFCLVPGIYLKVIWVFSLALAADRKLEFWPALELSRQTVSKHWFKVAALMLVAYLPVVLFTIYSAQRTSEYLMATLGDPLAALTLRWDKLGQELEQVARFAARLELQKQVVLLLNLPFAYAALLYAYEHIFGRGRAQGD